MISENQTQTEKMQQKNEILFLFICYILILTGIILRIDYIVTYNPLDNLFSDPQRHWEQGTDLFRSDPMSTSDPILYQIYIALLAKITAGIPELIAFYTILLSIITPWIWYRFLIQIKLSKKIALAGWAIYSLIPNWINIYGYFMQETLFLPLLGISLISTWRSRETKTSYSFVITIVLWTLTGLTRGIAIPMAATATIWLWTTQNNKLRKLTYFVLVIAFLLGPLTYRNYQNMQLVSPHGIGYMNSIYALSNARKIEIHFKKEGYHWFYVFQSPAVDEQPFLPISEWKSSRNGTVTLDINIDKGWQDWQTNFDKYQLDYGSYLNLIKENSILLFFTESWPDSNLDRWQGKLNHYSKWIWPILLIVFLYYFFKNSKSKDIDLLLPTLFFVWLATQTLLPISVNEGRYRLPATGILVALILCQINKSHQKPQDRKVNE